MSEITLSELLSDNPIGPDDSSRHKDWQLGCQDGRIGAKPAKPNSAAYMRGWEFAVAVRRERTSRTESIARRVLRVAVVCLDSAISGPVNAVTLGFVLFLLFA